MPSLSLPKGGGAIRGMGEKFAANPVTGTGSLTIPLPLSPGRSGFTPSLSLSYDSGAGNGPFGYGWNLSLPSITRKTDKGLPKYQDATESDVFILSGAEDLVPVLENGQPKKIARNGYTVYYYRPRIEGLFARIERWVKDGDGDTHWRSISKDNITTLYGKTEESRIADPEDSQRIFTWLICESYDDKGNATVYSYAKENSSNIDVSQVNERNRTDKSRSANRYLKRVQYGNTVSRLKEPDLSKLTWHFEAVLDYGEHDPNTPAPDDDKPLNGDPPKRTWPIRPDPFSSYRAGFEVRTYRRCQRVLMFHHISDLPTGEKGYEGLVRSLEFDYNDYPYPTNFTVQQELEHPGSTYIASKLGKITSSGYKKQSNGSYLKKSLPPLEFTYSQAIINEDIQTLDESSLENLPIGVDGAQYQWVDLYSEGLSGILTEQANAWYYKPNRGGSFGGTQLVLEKPSFSLQSNAQLLDLAGDGLLDLVDFERPVAGFFEQVEKNEWSPFTPFTNQPNIDWNDPNLKFVDLTGDGHADVLITEDQVLRWYRSLAEEGFAQEERIQQFFDEDKGPKLVFADGTQSIYLSDMSGDGLTDLVRIRNGEVCYWPNLGYGKFGTKVTMDDAPWFDAPDIFDQKRIRLADIDGSGVTDIIYLAGGGVHLYFNRSGNSWSQERILPNFPKIDNVSSVNVVDLFGNGTACLVRSSPLPAYAGQPMYYLDLMKDGKPHLLVATKNNLGAETKVFYAASTKFYVEDELEGNPWVTKLPFPVHVVERTETYDHISKNRFVTRYKYHHGYFDGIEREFRGFGFVEQWDTEEIGSILQGDNWDKQSFVPPIHTKTWFHTGAYFDAKRLEQFYKNIDGKPRNDAYFREPGLTDPQFETQLLPDAVLPTMLTPQEEREAYRALKGAMLRQEVYADDGPGKTGIPYTVAEQNYTIRCLQNKGTNRFAVFFTHAREVLTYHYERNATDPRIQHALTLEVDDFGNVLKSVAIGYGRRTRDSGLPTDQDRDKQSKTLATLSENTYTKDANKPTSDAIDEADIYRTPLPCEALSYELSGTGLTNTPLTFEGVKSAVDKAQLISYEVAPTTTQWQKRVIEHSSILYRKNDLNGALGKGMLESLALPFETYTLAFTPKLLGTFNQDGTDLLSPNAVTLMKECGYVDLDSDGHYWIPSGKMFYHPDPTVGSVVELGEAQGHFFLPRCYRDPFNQHTSVTFDNYGLLMKETKDALANVAKAENNYRVLQPFRMTDPNENQIEVAFDALGLVAGTAVMGKVGQASGDTLANFNADLTQNEIDGFFATPRGAGSTTVTLLKGATTRIIYDVDRFQRLNEPPFAATLARETHVSETRGVPTIQASFSYSDGFGREVQKKIQAEKGLVVKGGQDVEPRWVGSGWTVFNNKGKPIKQYEPFFDDTHDFKKKQKGVTSLLFYDPVERVVATLHPNHTWEKVVFNPWQQETWDVNDTVTLDPKSDETLKPFLLNSDGSARLPESQYLPTWHQLRTDAAHAAAFEKQYQNVNDRDLETKAAGKAAAHAGTPTTAYLDSLGRTFLTIAKNGTAASDVIETRVLLDIEGNPRAVIDARDLTVMSYDYSMLSQGIHQTSMDAGERWTLNDVTGKPIRAWDSRGHSFRTEYDELRRPVRLFVTGADEADPSREILFEHIIYGDGKDPKLTLTPRQILDANLRGKPYKHFDGAGEVTNESYDFKGNLKRSTRQLTKDYKTIPDWSRSPILEAEVFSSGSRYDALNRTVQLVAPHSSANRINVQQPLYNEANLFEGMDVWLEHPSEPTALLDPTTATFKAVTNIDYDAKGQRERIEYGNGTQTLYDYDDFTFRLTKRRTTNGAGRTFQDLSYHYDPVGNITHIRDDAQQDIYFNGVVVKPHNEYSYDAIYRLIEAFGREHLGQIGNQPNSGPAAPDAFNRFHTNLDHRNNGAAMGSYRETYSYDKVGNILEMRHQGTDPNHPGWKRCYQYATDSNRLLSTTNPNDPHDPTIPCPTPYDNTLVYQQTYDYDAHGNMTKMPHLPLMRWNFKDQLQATAQQVMNNGTPVTTYYVYDSSGQRVRKVTEHQASAGTTLRRKEERIYLGGFEVYRSYEADGNTTKLERETLHVMDDKQRVALVETRTKGADGTSQQLIRYQYGNHLGSAMLELNDKAEIISYEEYFPYGSTSYQAVDKSIKAAAKRYRYTGKERDEECGFYYHGARYYAAWIGRWLSCDPIMPLGGLDVYVYAANNPLRFFDPSGMVAESTQTIETLREHASKMDKQVSRMEERTHEIHLQAAALDAALETLLVPTTHNKLLEETGEGTHFGSESDFAKNPNSDKTGLIECNCILYQFEPLELYFKSLEEGGELPVGTWNTTRSFAEDARGPWIENGKVKKATDVPVARDTALMQKLREMANFTTVLLDRGELYGDGTLKSGVKAAQGNYPPIVHPVVGVDSGKRLDVRTPIDIVFENSQADQAAALDYLNNLPFAIITENYGYHTRVLSFGMVYEAHWAIGPNDKNNPLFESTTLSRYLSSQKHVVFAVPPGYEFEER